MTLRTAIAALVLLVMGAFPAWAEDVRLPTQLGSETLPQVLRSLLDAVDAGNWAGIDDGLAEAVPDPADPADRELFDLARQLLGACLETRSRWTVDRVASLRQAAQASDAAAWRHEIALVAFDATRAQIADNVRAQLRPRVDADARNSTARTMYDLVISPLLTEELVAGELEHAVSNIAFFQSQLESEEILGQAERAETRRLSEYADAGIALLDELRKVIALHDPEAGEVSPRHAPLAGTGEPPTQLDLAAVDDLIAISRVLGEAASKAEWNEMVEGWRLSRESNGAGLDELPTTARAMVQARQACDLLAELGSKDHRSLIWLSISERRHARLATALAVLGYEQVRMLLSENVRSQLERRPDCQKRLVAARRVFIGVVEPWLMALPVEQKGTGVDSLRLSMRGLSIPASGEQEVVDEHGRQVVRILRQLVERIRESVASEFSGTAAVIGQKGVPPRPIAELIRESTRLLLAGDALSARRNLIRALDIESVNERAQELFDLANLHVAGDLGDVDNGNRFLTGSGLFLSLLTRVRADAENDRWVALRAGYTSETSIRSGPASAGRDLRDTVSALLSTTGRNRHSLIEAALVRQDPEVLDNGLLILAFDACRAQMIRNRTDGLRNPQVTQAANRFLRMAVNKILTDSEGRVSAERVESVQQALADTIDPELSRVDRTAPADAQERQRIENALEYTRRSLVLTEELIPVVAPRIRAAGDLASGEGTYVIPEGQDLLETVRELRAAAAADAWNEMLVGYMEGPVAGSAAATAGRRLADLQRLMASVFASSSDSRDAQIRRALERREEKHLEIALVLLSFDHIRVDVLRNSQSLLTPRAQVVERNQRIAAVYHEMISGVLQGDAQIVSVIEDRLRQLNTPELIGTEVGAAEPIEPSLDNYSEAAVDLLELVAGALGASEIMSTLAPEPFEAGDPGAFVGMIEEVREVISRGDWGLLRTVLTRTPVAETSQEQLAAMKAADELRRRIAEIDGEREIALGAECLIAAEAESASEFERALLALAYETIRLKYSRNVGDGLAPGRLATARGQAARGIYEAVLSRLVVALKGSGDSAGELRDARIRSRFERVAALEAYRNEAERPEVRDYLREVFPLLREISSAVVLLDPDVSPGVRSDVEGEPVLTRPAARRRPLAPFRADDPSAFLELVRLLGEPLRPEGWGQLVAGFSEVAPHSASDPNEHEAVDLGRRLRVRCELVDSMRGTTRTAVFGRLLELHDEESLLRALLILSVDTVKTKVIANVSDRLAPRDRCIARNRAISAIYEAILRPIVLAGGSDGGQANDARIRGLLEELSSKELLSLPLEESVLGYYERARAAMADMTAAVRELPELEGDLVPTRPAQPFEAGDPEAYLATVRAAREAADTGRWGEMLHGFQEGGSASDLDTDAMSAGRDLRRRAEEIDEAGAGGQVDSMLQYLQEGDAGRTGFDAGMITLSFDQVRAKVLRNIRDRLRPYSTAARRNLAIQRIYGEVLEPLVLESSTGGGPVAAEIRTALEEFDAPELMGTDPATDVEPVLLADPVAYGELGTQVLVELSRALGGTDLAPAGIGEGAEDPEWARLAKKYDSFSDDFFLLWAVDAFRVALQLNREGEVLQGLREGGKLRQGDRKAVSAGRAIHGTCALINKVVGNDLLPEWDKALAAVDREILNRLLVLTAFEVIRLKLNDNIGTGLRDYEQVVKRQKAARAIYDSVCRVAVYGPEKQDMVIGQLEHQLIARRFSRLESVDLIGPEPTTPGEKRRVDVAGYRQASVELLEFLLTAISDPEKAIERFEGKGPRPFNLPIERR